MNQTYQYASKIYTQNTQSQLICKVIYLRNEWAFLRIHSFKFVWYGNITSVYPIYQHIYWPEILQILVTPVVTYQDSRSCSWIWYRKGGTIVICMGINKPHWIQSDINMELSDYNKRKMELILWLNIWWNISPHLTSCCNWMFYATVRSLGKISICN